MISVENLEKKFDERTVLGPLTTSFKEGHIYGLLGSNGSGKSTLLRCLSGIYQPDGGQIYVGDQKPVFENIEFKNQMYLVSDDPYYFPQSSMAEMAAYYRKFYSAWDETTYERFCSVFPLDQNARLTTFSKGMRRQAAIILGFSASPTYIYLDEAFDGLDPVMRNTVKRMMMEELAEKNATIILTSHNINEFENICDEVLILHEGQLIDKRATDEPGGVIKIQIALEKVPTLGDFSDLEVRNMVVQGRLATFIVKGEEEEILLKLQKLDPVFVEVLPVTLEEIFLLDMQEVGYNAADNI